MIDWNDNAKAAVEAFAAYIGYERTVKLWLESKGKDSQTKTVADAVEWANSKWKGDGQFIAYQGELNKFAFVESEAPYKNGWVLVCTREQFEAYVAGVEQVDLDIDFDKMKSQYNSEEQEGEKWTHVYCGEKCSIVTDKPDVDGDIVCMTECGEYSIIKADDIKPIKPTISKTEAWDMLKQTPYEIRSLDDALIAITDKYEVTDD